MNKEIKREYIYPHLMMYTTKDNKWKLIKNVFDVETVECTNDVWQLNFKMSLLDDEANNFKEDGCEYYVRFLPKNDFYIVKNIELDKDVNGTLIFTCYREEIALKGIYCECLNEIAKTPEELFNSILTNAKSIDLKNQYIWKGTDVPSNKLRSIKSNDEATIWDNMLTLAEKFEGWWEFTTEIDKNENVKRYVYLRTTPIDQCYIVRDTHDIYSHNLNKLNINYNTQNIVTRMYGYGANDKIINRPINILNVNPTKKAYVESYDYFRKAKNMGDEEILNDPACLQEGTFRDENIVDEQDLYNATLEELKKKCIPEVSGNIEIADLYDIYGDMYLEDGTQMKLNIGEKVKVINEDINYIFDCMVTKINRHYGSENIFHSPIEISNITTKFSNPLQDIIDNNKIVDRVTDIENDGSPYIPAKNVKLDEVDKEGSHINIPYKLGEHQTQITENANEIKLTAEELGKAKAEIQIQADRIDMTVEDLNNAKAEILIQANKIAMTVEDLNEAKSEINMMADEINLKVSKGNDFSSEMKQNVNAFQFLFKGASNGKTEISSKGIDVYQGGFRILDDDDNVLMHIDSDGTMIIQVAGINDLNIYDTSKNSMFYHTLANMREISTGEVKPKRLTLDYRDFYIGTNGYDLKEFVERIADGRSVD